MGCFWRMLLLRTLAINIQVLLQNTVNSNDDENVINEIIQYCIDHTSIIEIIKNLKFTQSSEGFKSKNRLLNLKFINFLKT